MVSIFIVLLGTVIAGQFFTNERLMGDNNVFDSSSQSNRDYRSLYKLFKKIDFLENYNPYAYYGLLI